MSLQTNTSPLKKHNYFFNGYSESLSRKGFDDFLLLATKYPTKKFIAIADDESIQFYNQNPRENLEVIGQCSYSEVIDIYKNSEYMILPSKSESFGLVYIEAASHGLPVLGFAPIINEFNSYLSIEIGIPYYPEYQSKEELLTLFDKLNKSKYDRENIINTVREKFTWKNKINEYIDIYESIPIKNT